MLTPYEERNRKLWQQSNGIRGKRIPLPGKDEDPFWSVGIRGCLECGADLQEEQHLKYFEIKHNGETTTGWACYESIQRRQKQSV